MTDLTTTYLGLELKNPFIASSSPMAKKIDNVKRMEDAGISAVVLHSLFEEQIVKESLALNQTLDFGTESFPEALTYFPDLDSYNIGPEKYLKLIRKLKENVDIPIIGSLNGYSRSGWIDYAEQIQQAGADAIELNIYYLPIDTMTTSDEVEQAHIELVANMHDVLTIPMAVKLSPYFSAVPNLARRLSDAGAEGLVLFNRFYQVDFNIKTLDVTSRLEFSRPYDMLLPLRWIAILHNRIEADLAITTGVHDGEDMVKAIMAGATAAMSSSILYMEGIEHAKKIIEELKVWMERNGYETIDEMKGILSLDKVTNPEAYERANYMRTLTSTVI
jgi:dihydroorotate dehydrogenase (fumarate)